VTLSYLLDTNIISEPLRPVPNPAILIHIERHQDEIAIAAIVWHELWFGCSRLPASARRTAIETYLTKVVAPAVPILAYDQRAAEWHALERTRLAQVGKTPPFADGQIAATAVMNDLTLITLNRDDFGAFQGLRTDDWRSNKVS
jgi:tRNA(fMet)-specific endonuclease VapC